MKPLGNPLAMISLQLEYAQKLGLGTIDKAKIEIMEVSA
jgi:hypothetical protein